MPLGRHQEQGIPVRPSEHASEATAIKLNGLEHLTTFAHAHATLVGNVGVPHSVVGVDADTVGDATAKIGPNSPLVQSEVLGDLVCRLLLEKKNGDDQG